MESGSEKVVIKIVGGKPAIEGTVLEKGLMGSPTLVKDDNTGIIYRKASTGLYEPLDQGLDYFMPRKIA